MNDEPNRKRLNAIGVSGWSAPADQLIIPAGQGGICGFGLGCGLSAGYRRRMSRMRAAARWFIAAWASTASASDINALPAGPVGPSEPGYGVAPRSTLAEESPSSGVLGTGAGVHGRVGVLSGDDLHVHDLGGFSFPVPLDSQRIVFDLVVAISPMISSADSIAASMDSTAGPVGFSGSLGPAMIWEIPSKTASHGLVIPTSTDTAFFAASPLRPTRL